jgi:hypothetical protein
MDPHARTPTPSCGVLETSCGNGDDRQSVLIVADLATDEIDAYGPMTRAAAFVQAERVRVDLQGQGLYDVLITVAPLWEPPAAEDMGCDRS